MRWRIWNMNCFELSAKATDKLYLSLDNSSMSTNLSKFKRNPIIASDCFIWLRSVDNGDEINLRYRIHSKLFVINCRINPGYFDCNWYSLFLLPLSAKLSNFRRRKTLFMALEASLMHCRIALLWLTIRTPLISFRICQARVVWLFSLSTFDKLLSQLNRC